MSIGAGGVLGATLMLGLALGTAAASAQTSPQGAWTDPPARSAAPAASGPAVASPAVASPAAASPAAPVKEPIPAATSASRSAESPAVSRSLETKGPETASKVDTPAPVRVRQAAKPPRKPVREVRRARPEVVAAAPRVRIATPRLIERREVRPVPRRVAARAYAPRTFAAALPYPYAPLPVGRVVGPVDGDRNPIFAEGIDRTRRIAAAQAAGYLVVRARAVHYPDGRIMRSYRPYDEDDGLD